MSRSALILCAIAMTVCLHGTAQAAGQSAVKFGKSSPQEILDAALAHIQQLEADGWDIGDDTYEFYFRGERLLHPEFYATRHDRSESMDQFLDTCPGGLIVGPEWEDDAARGFGGTYIVSTCGQTTTARNDCSYPRCRFGRDVVVTLEVPSFTGLYIRTAGSSFDTYLCLYEDECCSSDNDYLVESNNNFPELNYGQPLAAGIATCLPPGTYYLILDGATTAARGSYCVQFEFTEFCF